jgi:hypothetical protein
MFIERVVRDLGLCTFYDCIARKWNKMYPESSNEARLCDIDEVTPVIFITSY